MKSMPWIFVAALFALGACDGTTNGNDLSRASANETPTISAEAPPPEVTYDTPFEALIAGQSVTVELDACDAADADAWDGDTDAAGILVCGTSYELHYDQDTNMILASGLEENPAGGEPTMRSNGREWTGTTNRFNIWGARHYMLPNGDILDKNNELVGHVTG